MPSAYTFAPTPAAKAGSNPALTSSSTTLAMAARLPPRALLARRRAAMAAAFGSWEVVGCSASGAASTTVTLHLATRLLKVFTATVAVPGFRPVTRPSASTEATSGSLLLHVNTDDAPAVTFAVSWAVCPTAIESFFSDSATFFGASTTFTFTVAFRPLWVFTATVAVPAFLAVISPLEETFATDLSLLAKRNTALSPAP